MKTIHFLISKIHFSALNVLFVYLLLTATLLPIGCSSESSGNTDYHAPLHYSKNDRFATVLTEDGKVHLVEHKRNKHTVTEVDLDDVVSISSGMAITSDGELYSVSLRNTKNPEKIRLKKKVMKYYSFGEYDIVLYRDGTIGFTFQELFGKGKNPIFVHRVNLNSFPPLIDVVVAGAGYNMYILGLTEAGKVYMAGGQKKDDGSNILAGYMTFIEDAIEVEGLSDIKKIGRIYYPYAPYCIDSEGNVKFWMIEKEDMSIQTLNVKAKNILNGRLVSPDEKIYRVMKTDDKKSLQAVEVGEELVSDAYALWFKSISQYDCVGISKNGTLLTGTFEMGLEGLNSAKAISHDDIKIGTAYFE